MSALVALGVATSLAGAGMSFYQASQQKKLQKEAEAKAASAMQEARKRLEKNYLKTLGINREPYELEREALLSTGSQLINAGVESERGASATAGRVLQMQNVGQRNIAGAMGDDLLGLNKLVASEESRLRDANVELDLGTVEGAQLAARNNEMLANNNIKSGFQGLTKAADMGLDYMALYPNTNSVSSQSQIKTPEVITPNEQLGHAPTAAQTAYDNALASGSLGTDFTQNGQQLSYNQALNLFTKNQPGMTESDFAYYLQSLNTNPQFQPNPFASF